MRELPTGTVTFLFTDIEGSTRLLSERGDAYAEALAEHRRVLRAAFLEHGGVEVDTHAAERGDAERAAALWAAIEAEEAKAPESNWAVSREKYAAHIPDEPRPAALPFEEAVEYALGDID